MRTIRRSSVPESTLAVLLERMGLPCGNATQIRHSAAALEAELSGRKLPPLMTAEIERGIALPAAAIKSGSHYRIELESGSIIDGRFTAPKGEEALLAPIDEPGYHTLVINEQHVTLAVAPSHCYTVADAWRTLHDGATAQTPPLWGIAAQLYGLRRKGDGGIGDYTALAQMAIESAKRGAHALAVSPTHAMFSAEPNRFSPYSPSSRLWLNVTHIDPAAVFGADAARAALETAQATGALVDTRRLAADRLAERGRAEAKGFTRAVRELLQAGARARHAARARISWLLRTRRPRAGRSRALRSTAGGAVGSSEAARVTGATGLRRCAIRAARKLKPSPKRIGMKSIFICFCNGSPPRVCRTHSMPRRDAGWPSA